MTEYKYYVPSGGQFEGTVSKPEPLLTEEELKILLGDGYVPQPQKHNPPNPLDDPLMTIEELKNLLLEIPTKEDEPPKQTETPVVSTDSILINDLEKFSMALNGNQQCGSLFGFSEFSGQLSGHALIDDPGIIPKDICGKTIKIEVNLTVIAAQLVQGVNDPDKLSLTFTGNPSNLVGKLHVEDMPSEEKNEDCHRFTGFMDSPKDF